MKNSIFITVLQGDCVYDNFVVTKNCISSPNDYEIPIRPSKKKVKLITDGIFLYYFVRELSIACNYRKLFIDNFNRCATTNKKNGLVFLLVSPQKEIIDYGWDERLTYLVRERCELEHVMSWLSTLGGAFSALGDYFVNCAEMAGKISLNQLKLAIRLGDPNIVSRCMLYISLSLIQRQRYKLAKMIIYKEYMDAKNEIVRDFRLINMCKGIWCKLKYEHENYRNCKRRRTK